MMKKYLFFFLLGISGLVSAQNALLSSPTTGNITAPTYNFEFVYDENDLLLVTASYSTGFLYAIDFNASNADGVHNWETNTITNILGNIASILGSAEANLSVWDMKVNPKTNAVVLLIFDSVASNTYLFEAKNPSDISLISLTDVTYSRIKYTLDGNYIHDMEWSTEESKLYYAQGDFTLDASVGFASTPFAHNSEGTINATSVFKSNWGGSYFTFAPLEKLSISKVNGENRLMGVTTCAPGFSIPTKNINEATEIISVSEDFNVNFLRPLKVVTVSQESGLGTATYLFDLHEHSAEGTQIVRVGEKYLTGEVLDTNNLADLVRNGIGNVPGAFDENDVKEMALGYEMIAFYSEYDLMVVDDNDVLRLMDITSKFLTIDEGHLNEINVQPTPATDFVKLSYQPENGVTTTFEIYNVNGQVVHSGNFFGQEIDIRTLKKGNYILALTNDRQVIGSVKLIKQ